MPSILSAGPTLILDSSSTGPGSWFRVPPNMGALSFHAVQIGSSIGATVGTTINIEASNDGENALATKLGTIAFNGGSPQSDGLSPPTSMGGRFEYVRASLNSITTGGVQVYASGQMRS